MSSDALSVVGSQQPAGQARPESARPPRRLGNSVRTVIILGWVVWGAAFAYWRELASPKLLSFAGVTVYPTDILIVLTLVFGHLELLGILYSDQSSRREKFIAGLVGFYVLYTLCIVWPGGVISGLGPAESIRAVSLRFMVLVVPLVMGLLRRDPELEGVLIVVPGIMTLPLLFGAVGNALSGSVVASFEDGYSRIRFLWGGSILLFAWPVFVGLLRERVSRARFAIVLGVSGVIGILLTNHRSAYVALALSLPLLLRPRNKVGKRLLLVFGVAAVLVLVVLAAASLSLGDAFGYTAERLLDYAGGNGADRLMRWRLALDTFSSVPFNDITWSRQWYLVELSRNYGPHNWLLEVAVSEGVIGLVFYSGLFAALAGYSLAWAKRDGLASGLTAYVVFFLVFCLFNTNFYAMANQPFLWLACGLLSRRCEMLASDAERSMRAEVASVRT